MFEHIRRCRSFAAAVLRFAGRRAAWAALLATAGAALEGVGILLLVPVIAIILQGGVGDDVQMTGGADGFASFVAPFDRLLPLLAAFAALMALRVLVLWRRDLLLGRLQIEFVEQLRARLSHALAGARWQHLACIGHGRVTHLMSGDVQRCGAGVHFLLQSGVALAMLVAQVTLALFISPTLTVIAVGLLIAGAAAMFVLGRRASGLGQQVTEANLSLMTGLGRFLGGIKLAISQNLQDNFVRALKNDLETGGRRQAEFIGQQSLLRGLWGLLAAVVAGAVVLLGHEWLALPAPLLLALLVVLARMSAPAMQIQLGLQQIAYSLPAWEAVEGMRIELTAAAAPINQAKESSLSGVIELENVGYDHGRGEGGVHGIDLRLMPGTTLGIAGPSGAGKSTLADLVAGLLHPQEGQIKVGGVPLGDHNVALWRDRIAYVAQEPFLFHDTIRANLLWSAPYASTEEIARALAAVGADGLIGWLAEGLETKVGEKGALISGGERQRIAIARALLRRPELLILDEATSAMDLAAEKAVLAGLSAARPRPSILMIAHRPETLVCCDRILVLEGGKPASPRCAGMAA